MLLRDVVSRDVRPEFPDGFPAGVRNLATACWSSVTERRPSFREAHRVFAEATKGGALLLDHSGVAAARSAFLGFLREVREADSEPPPPSAPAWRALSCSSSHPRRPRRAAQLATDLAVVESESSFLAKAMQGVSRAVPFTAAVVGTFAPTESNFVEVQRRAAGRRQPPPRPTPKHA